MVYFLSLCVFASAQFFVNISSDQRAVTEKSESWRCYDIFKATIDELEQCSQLAIITCTGTIHYSFNDLSLEIVNRQV